MHPISKSLRARLRTLGHFKHVLRDGHIRCKLECDKTNFRRNIFLSSQCFKKTPGEIKHKIQRPVSADEKRIAPTSSLAAELLAGIDNGSMNRIEDRNASKFFDSSEELENELKNIQLLMRSRVSDIVTDDEISDSSDDIYKDEIISSIDSDTSTAYAEELSLANSSTLVPVPRYKDKVMAIYGSANRSVPMSKIPCHGCGALLHCRDPGIPGYLPAQKFLAKTVDELKEEPCQRCHLLTKFNIAIDAAVGPDDYKAIVSRIERSRSLIVVLVDLTDMPSSLYSGLWKLVGKEYHQIYIVGNKVDLLPKDDDGYLTRIKESLMQQCIDNGLENPRNVKHIALVSAKTGYGIEDLISQMLRDWTLKGHVYILGCTNVGKSTLFNALLSSDWCRHTARDIIRRATTSVWPGTTLNLLKFPIVNPRPDKLYHRAQRLQMQRCEWKEEEKLKRQTAKFSRDSKYATLMGHIGQTFQTPQEFALERKAADYHGFIVPTYSASDSDPTRVKEHTGKAAILEDDLNPDIEKYDESLYKYWCYDTPGLVNPDQVINLLTPKELDVVLENKVIEPRTFALWPGQVIFITGLARIDFLEGQRPVYFTVFASSGAQVVHAESTAKADDFYRVNIGTQTFGIPLDGEERIKNIPTLVGREFHFKGAGLKESAVDIILSSIGWVAVTAPYETDVKIKAYTPAGLGCTVRTPSLLRYAVNQRGKKIRGTPAYRVYKP